MATALSDMHPRAESEEVDSDARSVHPAANHHKDADRGTQRR